MSKKFWPIYVVSYYINGSRLIGQTVLSGFLPATLSSARLNTLFGPGYGKKSFQEGELQEKSFSKVTPVLGLIAIADMSILYNNLKLDKSRANYVYFPALYSVLFL